MRAGILALSTLAASCGSIFSPADWPRAPLAAANTPQSQLEELTATDRSYSAASTRAEGFSAMAGMFDEDVVMFAVPVPGFAHGRAEAINCLTTALGTNRGTIEWLAIRTGISADGQHGFTFGYATTRVDGEPDRVSKYVAYWVRRPEGWRVALYKLVPRAAGSVALTPMNPVMPRALTAVSNDAATLGAHRESLARREEEFSEESVRIGLGPAFAQFGRADAVNVGNGAEFVVGAQNIGAAQPGPPGSPVVWSADQGVLVASSGDLGVTWGYLRRTGPTPRGRLSQIPFFTIWHREGPSQPWLYLAE